MSRYAGSSRQQVAALLWQVGVRFLSSDIAHGNGDDADGDGACLARDPLTEICVLFELLRELVGLFLYFIQTSVYLRDLLALRVG